MRNQVYQTIAHALKQHLSGSLDGGKVEHLIEHTYLPILHWTSTLITQKQAQRDHQCVVIGLSCVQGGGKTTACRILKTALTAIGRKCAVISLDDVYLTYIDQLNIAKENSANPLLQYRGNPGTHDLRLLLDFISECKQPKTIAIPSYDKSRNQGRGDRVPKEQWDTIEGPLDVLLIEGWCLGFQAIESTNVPSPHLLPINQHLKTFELLYRELNGLILFRVSDLHWVYRWREEQEASMRRANKPSLTSAQVTDFVDRYMPSYHLYLQALYYPSEPLSQLHRLPRLVIDIDQDRNPIHTFKVENKFSK